MDGIRMINGDWVKFLCKLNASEQGLESMCGSAIVKQVLIWSLVFKGNFVKKLPQLMFQIVLWTHKTILVGHWWL